jgi:hypothetical protein
MAYRIGTAGVAWTAADRAAWLAQTSVQRTYQEHVLQKIDKLKENFDVEQYGALPFDAERYPLFAVRTKNWSAEKPTVLVTGGVHGYETSGVQGALLFLETKALDFAATFNVVVCPCVSPWGYETIQRWNYNAEDPNRGFVPDSSRDECALVMKYVKTLGEILVHLDLHETTDTDETEFGPAKSARDGVKHEPDTIPDGFYLIGDDALPQNDWHATMIEAVKEVTHIAKPDEHNNIIGFGLVTEGFVTGPNDAADGTSEGYCAAFAGAKYSTTTEVYPDSPQVNDEQCSQAQVAAVVSGLQFVAKVLEQ